MARPRSPPIDLERAKELYFADGLTLREIAKKLGVPHWRVQCGFKAHGVVCRPPGQRTFHPPKPQKIGKRDYTKPAIRTDLKPGVSVEMKEAGEKAERDLIRRGVMLP
jgi:hypothetical protein